MICSVFDLARFAADIDFQVARRGNSNEPNSSELRGVDALQPPAKSTGHNPDVAINCAGAVVGFESDKPCPPLKLWLLRYYRWLHSICGAAIAIAHFGNFGRERNSGAAWRNDRRHCSSNVR